MSLNLQSTVLPQFGPIIGGSLTGLALICVLVLLFALNIISKSQEKKPILNGNSTGEHELAVLGKRNYTNIKSRFKVNKIKEIFDP